MVKYYFDCTNINKQSLLTEHMITRKKGKIRIADDYYAYSSIFNGRLNTTVFLSLN